MSSSTAHDLHDDHADHSLIRQSMQEATRVRSTRAKPQRKPLTGQHARAAAAAARAAAAAGATADPKARSRPGALAIAELQARAGGLWAQLAAQDAHAHALQTAQRKKVCI